MASPISPRQAISPTSITSSYVDNAPFSHPVTKALISRILEKLYSAGYITPSHLLHLAPTSVSISSAFGNGDENTGSQDSMLNLVKLLTEPFAQQLDSAPPLCRAIFYSMFHYLDGVFNGEEVLKEESTFMENSLLELEQQLKQDASWMAQTNKFLNTPYDDDDLTSVYQGVSGLSVPPNSRFPTRPSTASMLPVSPLPEQSREGGTTPSKGRLQITTERLEDALLRRVQHLEDAMREGKMLYEAQLQHLNEELEEMTKKTKEIEELNKELTEKCYQSSQGRTTPKNTSEAIRSVQFAKDNPPKVPNKRTSSLPQGIFSLIG